MFVEPIQGSGGGCLPSPTFHQTLSKLCTDHGTPLIFDEILTGFHRTGSPFLFESLGVTPDIVLIGKAMGNGFPVSGVVVRRSLQILPHMLPGSTYASNPLAAAVVSSTLKHMGTLSLPSAVAQIGKTIETQLEPVRVTGVALRGMGALWILEFPSQVDASAVATRAMANGVVVSPRRSLASSPPAGDHSPR